MSCVRLLTFKQARSRGLLYIKVDWLNNCVQEGDLTSADLDQSTSAHTLSRVSAGSSESKNLYPYIDLARCHGVNLHTPDATRAILRPHNERDEMDEEKSLVNLDEDDGVMLNVRLPLFTLASLTPAQVIFSEMCRVKSVLVSAPPSGDERVARCRIWVNRPHGIDLGDADDVPPDQEFELLEQERGAVEYPVRVSRFANVSSLTVNFVRADLISRGQAR